MGMRVKAKWADELKPDHTSIKWFEPTGEPDADYERYKDYLHERRWDVAVVSFAQEIGGRAATREHNEVEIIVPVVQRGDRASRASPSTTSGS